MMHGQNVTSRKPTFCQWYFGKQQIIQMPPPIKKYIKKKTKKLVNSLQKQVSVMSMNLSAKLDELQRGDRHMETTVALCEIRTQLQELTKSVESCQSEVSEVGYKFF